MYDTIFQYKKLRGKLSFVQCQLCFNHSFMCFSDVTPYFALHKDPVRQLFSTTGNSSPHHLPLQGDIRICLKSFFLLS